MTNRLAILCPGQGGQHPQMFDFARTEPHANALLDQLPFEEILGVPLDTALTSALYSNRIAQPLIVAAAAASWCAVRDLIPKPALVAGYSIGELSAYAVADALGAEEAIRLAAFRARMMDECARASTRQMLMSVSGISTTILADLLPADELFIAIETGAESAIVGGSGEHVAELEKGVRRLGGRTGILPVEVASHTPFMRDAAKRFFAELQQRPFAPPSIPVLAGISGRMIYRSDEAISTLSEQIAEKIKWMDCMDACAEAGITIALELSPGSALSRMLREHHPHIACRSIVDFRTAAGVAKWIGNHFA